MKDTFSTAELQEVTLLARIIRARLDQVPNPQVLLHHEKRSQPRYAVNWSAMIRYENEPAWMPIYIRDISESGIGFHHGISLHEAIAVVSFIFDGNDPVQLRTQILWCKQTESGLYLSGSRFLGVAHDVPSPW